MSDQELKADGGKVQVNLLLAGVPDALRSVGAVLTYGAQKYEAHSWKRVDMERYRDAKARHQLDYLSGELLDPESGLLHLAHEACNNLFLLQAYLDDNPQHKHLLWNQPPTDHKTQE